MELMKRFDLKKWPYIFIAPYLIIYFIFGFFPILYSFYISLTEWDGIGQMSFVGFKNYVRLFTVDPYFLKSILNTLIFMAETLPLLLIGGLLLANLLNSRHIRHKRVFQLANFLPYLVTPVAVGIVFCMLFDWQTGTVNGILLQVGFSDNNINWLGEPWPARAVIGIMIVWKFLGYYMVIYLAGMANISNEIYEAAYVDGSKPVNTFLKITVPLLKPVISFLFITGVISQMQLFDEPKLLLGGWGSSGAGAVGGPDRSCLTAVWNLYDTAFGSSMKYGYSAAIGYGLFVFIFAFSLLGILVVNRREKEV